MKNTILFSAIFFALISTNCTNNNTPSPQPSPTNNSSKTVLYDVNNIGDPNDDDYCFMLLGADNSGQKKYFKAKMIDIVKDSMEVISGPYTLDSLIDVSTFPSYIKSANSGSYLTDFIFVDSIRVRQTGLNANGKRVFTQVSWSGNGSNYVKPYTNGAQIEGTTILNYFKKPTATGSFEGYLMHFFFKKGTCIVFSKTSASGTSVSVSGFPEDISSVIGATYDWQNVDNYFNVTTGVGISSHYFIDYKNWRYFRIKESKTSVTGTPGGQHAIEYGKYKSLDKLLKWPSDWKN